MRYIVQADQFGELTRLSNADNGQRDALVRALRRRFYGPPLFPGELSPESLAAGSLFVLQDDSRLHDVMPHDRWATRLRRLARGRSWQIRELEASP
jgi:hypothetical protein